MNIAIFASGSGTNAENIIKYFQNSSSIKVKLILSNKKDAYVLERARKLNTESIFLKKEDLDNPEILLSLLKLHRIDWIVLAGYLKLIPSFLIKAFPNKIINIHPALLPKFGGKGMYGMHVHEAVVENKERKTGITVHYVNENYDEGNIIAQAECLVDENDTAQDVADKIHILEMNHFPAIIDKLLTTL